MPTLSRPLAAACLLLSACQTQTQPIPLGSSLFLTNSAALLPAGNVHLVTFRDRDGHSVFCSEPSPDWAVAFGHSLTGALSASVNGGGGGSVSGSEATTQAITALVGRTAGVVALRDGLYAACQAYANGIIGKDAYALVLSQYGNLLVSLAAGGGSGSSGAGSSTPTIPAGVAVAVSTGAAAAPASSPHQPKPEPKRKRQQRPRQQTARTSPRLVRRLPHRQRPHCPRSHRLLLAQSNAVSQRRLRRRHPRRRRRHPRLADPASRHPGQTTPGCHPPDTARPQASPAARLHLTNPT